jgi:Ca2+-binding EF-hand superfamily protein
VAKRLRALVPSCRKYSAAFRHICLLHITVPRRMTFLRCVVQTVFFWTLIARKISRHYARSGERPPAPTFAWGAFPENGHASDDAQDPDGRAARQVPARWGAAEAGSLLRLHRTRDEGLTLSQEQEEQIEEAFRLFDTDDSGVLDEAELRSAMFALGYLTNYHDDISRAVAAVSGGLGEGGGGAGGVGLGAFRDLMRGALIERGGLEEIRMTFDVIVSSHAASQATEPAAAAAAAASPPLPRAGVVAGRGEGGGGATSGGLAADDGCGEGGDSVGGGSSSYGDRLGSAEAMSGQLVMPHAGRAQAIVATVGFETGDTSQARVSQPNLPGERAAGRGGGGGDARLRDRGVLGPCITFEMLRRACHRFDVRLSDDELRRVIRETDRDGSGDVDWAEYVTVLKNSCWF